MIPNAESKLNDMLQPTSIWRRSHFILALNILTLCWCLYMCAWRCTNTEKVLHVVSVLGKWENLSHILSCIDTQHCYLILCCHGNKNRGTSANTRVGLLTFRLLSKKTHSLGHLATRGADTSKSVYWVVRPSVNILSIWEIPAIILIYLYCQKGAISSHF